MGEYSLGALTTPPTMPSLWWATVWRRGSSTGLGWGEAGYIRLRRGVGMCGVGRTMVTLSCAPVPGPTDPPLTTEAPCDDKWSNCPSLTASSCVCLYMVCSRVLEDRGEKACVTPGN